MKGAGVGHAGWLTLTLVCGCGRIGFGDLPEDAPGTGLVEDAGAVADGKVDAMDEPGPAANCAGLLAASPASPSGVYSIDPDGPGGSEAYPVYCDMTTDGGGWTLVLAYAHPAFANEPPVEGPAPTDPTGGFSRLSVTRMSALAFAEVRMYCTTSGHPRILHFKTADPGAVAYVHAAGPNALSYWTSGFLPLAGHSANLPASADSIVDCQSGIMCTNPSGIMLYNPYYDYAVSHWSIYAFQRRWECDDFPDDASETTLHQIWVR